MSIAERIWLFYGPHAKRDAATGYVETSIEKSTFAKVVCIVESNEGSLVIEKYMHGSEVELEPHLWQSRIDNNLISRWENVWKPRLEKQYSERLGMPIEFEFSCLVAWFLAPPPKPYRVSAGALIIYPDNNDKV